MRIIAGLLDKPIEVRRISVMDLGRLQQLAVGDGGSVWAVFRERYALRLLRLDADLNVRVAAFKSDDVVSVAVSVDRVAVSDGRSIIEIDARDRTLLTDKEQVPDKAGLIVALGFDDQGRILAATETGVLIPGGGESQQVHQCPCRPVTLQPLNRTMFALTAGTDRPLWIVDLSGHEPSFFFVPAAGLRGGIRRR